VSVTNRQLPFYVLHVNLIRLHLELLASCLRSVESVHAICLSSGVILKEKVLTQINLFQSNNMRSLRVFIVHILCLDEDLLCTFFVYLVRVLAFFTF